MTNPAKIFLDTGRKVAKKLGMYADRTVNYSQCFIDYIGRGTVVLDLGCGTGSFSAICASSTSQVITVDIDIGNLRKIPPLKGVNKICCDAHNLPLRSESINTALAISVLEHVNNPELVLRELRYVLSSKGFLIIQLPNMYYYVEPHTYFPFLFILPKFIKNSIMTQMGYYTNFALSKKKLLQLIHPLFVVREIKPIYHVLKTPLWPPAWIIYTQKKGD